MKLTWFGHSAFRLEIGGSVVLIDPFLTGNPKFSGSMEQAAKGCTHVALTHGHDDHVGDTVEIARLTGAKVIAVYELALWLNGQGVENFDPVNTGGRLNLDDFTISFVEARHSSSTMDAGRVVYLGNPCGVVIRSASKALYHMGDTEIFKDMALINQIHKPDIGIVPIGDRFTMGARSAALACRSYFEFNTVIPCHYGTFPIIDQSPDRFIKEMAGRTVLVPEIGAPVEL